MFSRKILISRNYQSYFIDLSLIGRQDSVPALQSTSLSELSCTSAHTLNKHWIATYFPTYFTVKPRKYIVTFCFIKVKMKACGFDAITPLFSFFNSNFTPSYVPFIIKQVFLFNHDSKFIPSIISGTLFQITSDSKRTQMTFKGFPCPL